MTHKVKFTVKIVDEGDPDYKLLAERSEKFKTFTAALTFVRELKTRLHGKEVLFGQPIFEEAL